MFAPEPSWSEVTGSAVQNFVPDALSIAKGVSEYGTPLGFARQAKQGLKIGLGGIENLYNSVTGNQAPQISNEQQAASDFWNAQKEHFGNYLSEQGLKKNIAEHPAGVALDVATLLAPIKGESTLARAAETAPSKIKSVSELRAGAGAGYNVAKDSGVYFTKDFVEPLRDTLTSIAKERNFRPGRPGTEDLKHILEDVHAMTIRPWSFDDIQTLGRDLNDAWLVAKKAGREDLAGIAGKMRATVNQFLDNVGKSGGEGLYATGDLAPEQAASIFQQSNKIYRQAKVAQKLEAIGQKGSVDAQQFTQSGEANALKKYARQVLRQHYDGKPTGFNAGEIATLQDFNRGSLTEWMLKQSRRYLRSSVGAVLGGVLGGPIGSAVAVGAGEAAARMADRLAVQKFNRFVESVRAEGSNRLEALLGQAVSDHLMGTEAGRSGISKLVSSIGTKGYGTASKALALTVAQSVKRPDLTPRIYAELKHLEDGLQNFASQWQGSGPAEAQPDQGQ